MDAMLTWAQLEELRNVGDPDLEAIRRVPPGGWKGPDDLQPLNWDARGRHAAQSIDDVNALAPDRRDDFNVDRMLHAHQLFARFGGEISGALLLAALPQAYAAERGAKVLVARQANLATNADRRIRGTAQFLMLVMMCPNDKDEVREIWSPGGRAFDACLGLRVYHQAIRDTVGRPAPGEVPINQEDLLGTLLSFTVVVFEVLETYGISWTREEQEAYWYAWDVIGELLGIGTAAVDFEERDRKRPLRPQTVREGRLLLEQIRRRQWPAIDTALDAAADEQWRSLRPGRRLLRSLLDELVAAMPRLQRRWPAALIRAHAPAIVEERLGLGSGGLPQVLLDVLPGPTHIVGRFTELRTPNPMRGRLLRSMNNAVVRAAMLRFLRGSGDFVIPGLEDWTRELAESI